MVPPRSRPVLCTLVLFLSHLSPAGAAAQMPRIVTESGLRVFHFAVPEGRITVSIPDDVGPGERFSGTVEGPRGYLIDPARTAVAALSALVDGTSPAAANLSRRSRDEWIAYCGDLR